MPARSAELVSAKSAAAAADARQVWASSGHEAQAATRSLLAQASAGASADSAAEAMREIQSAERELRQIAQLLSALTGGRSVAALEAGAGEEQAVAAAEGRRAHAENAAAELAECEGAAEGLRAALAGCKKPG